MALANLIQSLSFILTVRSGGADFAYEAELVEPSPNQQQQADADGIDMASVTLEIDGTFLDAETIFDLPSEDDEGEGWRAKLEAIIGIGTESSTVSPQTVVLVNGAITRQDVSHVPYAELWTVTVVDQAATAFLERLEVLDLAAGDTESVNTYVKSEKGDSQVFAFDAFTWYDLQSLFVATVAQDASLTVAHQDTTRKWFHLLVDVGASGDVYRRDLNLYVCDPYRRESGARDLPEWTGRDLYDELAAMLGWRLKASYAAYPSTDITATLLTDFLAMTATPTAQLDEMVAADESGDVIPFDVRFEAAEWPDFGITYANKTAAPGLIYHSGSAAPVDTPPAIRAIYAAVKDRYGGSGEPRNENLVKLSVKLAHYKDVLTPTFTDGSYEETVTTAAPVIEEGSAWIAEIQSSFTVGRIIAQRAPTGGTIAGLEAGGPAWASVLFQNYQMRRAPSYRLRGDFDITGLLSGEEGSLPEVGDPLSSVIMAGRAWFVVESSIEYRLARALYELSSPVAVPDDEVDSPPIDAPENFAALFQEAALEHPIRAVRLSWNEPTARAGALTPSQYRLEWLPTPGEAWALVQTVSRTGASEVYMHEVGDVDALFMYRVRSENGAALSYYVYAGAV